MVTMVWVVGRNYV